MTEQRPDLRFARVCIFLTLAVTLAVEAFGQESGEPRATPAATLELVQTVPAGTELGLEGLRDTHVVWREMIDGATQRIDLAHFYASNAPEPGAGRLEPIVQALERAAERGVRVRFLADKKFYGTYPDTLDRIDAREGAEVRIYDVDALTGGVLHAKWMLVDGREGFLGSQNFDWRALEHIQELGVRFTGAPLMAAFDELFELDWRQAADETQVIDWSVPAAPAAAAVTADGTRVTPVYSPKARIPRGELWDLPRLVAAIDGAERSVRVQLLNYRTVAYGEGYWDGLETPLRRAAARGVKVELLVSHWATSRGTVEGLKSLTVLPNVEVRVLTVPENEAGFVPFARVAHSKLMAVDGSFAWIGTSNWQRGYFYESRNVGLVLEGGAAPATIDRYFRMGWGSPHAVPVDPARDYPKPRVGE
ncbi:MAG: phospholipase D-like domain-containing protein [Planctomycetota bacterium]